MHHVTLDSWSRIGSPIHRLDARVKILAVLAVLLSLVLTEHAYLWLFASYFSLIFTLAWLARLPLAALLLRAALVLPFAATVAALNVFGGTAVRAAAVLGKSYLSALAVLVLLASTPLHVLLRGLESLGAPRFFLMVAQFVYRYLFVLSEQAQHMKQARRCRAGQGGRGGRSLGASAAGALAVLFARSYCRAERIHHAMLARGFQGQFAAARPPSLRAADLVFLSVTGAVIAALQVLLWNR
ncbi:MAG TPA: energy-coupling factor transporter transmembrane component T [Bryobacterales bacterium]|jgi:cobalt/nickel transport system permease protein|nr:energy-coupling factor transporter transmembrane component T [Bryobacterales bacterium]